MISKEENCRRVKDHRIKNYAMVRGKDKAYKDKIRHGGKREELIERDGLACGICGVRGDRFKIITHHMSFDSKDHRFQQNLCRACHCRLHHSVEKKPLTKEQIEMAILTTKNLYEACRILGVNRASLYVKRKRLGLMFRQRS